MTLRAATWFAIGVVLVCVGWYAWDNPVHHGSSVSQAVELRADFGLKRKPITRSFEVDLCSRGNANDFPECVSTTGTNPSTAGARPDIISTDVVGDLIEVDPENPFTKRCNGLRRGSQFPSGQLTVAAENRGAQGITVSLTADPSQPERVHAGAYCGAVVVQRVSGNFVRLDLTASLEDPGQGGLRVRVFGALLGGALAGAAVKWLGDRYAPVALLRRRQRRLLRRLRPWQTRLPEEAQNDLAVIDDGIRFYDPEGLESPLFVLEQQGAVLARFGGAMSELDRLIAARERPGTASFEPPIGRVLAKLNTQGTELQSESYPWENADAVGDRSDQLRSEARAIRLSLEARDEEAYRRAVSEAVGAPTFAEWMASTGAPLETTEGPVGETVVSLPTSESRNFAQVLLDNSLSITMLVGGLVVAFVGYANQFMGDSSFNADSGDYLRLFAWAFAIQVAGTSVLEVAGKLVTSPPAAGPAASAGGS